MLTEFINSGRFLMWLAGGAMVVGIVVFMTGLASHSDDSAFGAGLLLAGTLVWFRAQKQERRFEKAQKKAHLPK